MDYAQLVGCDLSAQLNLKTSIAPATIASSPNATATRSILPSPSDHVFLAQGDMCQIPQDVQQRDMRFLDAVNAIAGDRETVLGSVC